MTSKVWDEITDPLPYFNSCAVEVREWIINNGCDYLSILGLKLIRMSKTVPGGVLYIDPN